MNKLQMWFPELDHEQVIDVSYHEPHIHVGDSVIATGHPAEFEVVKVTHQLNLLTVDSAPKAMMTIIELKVKTANRHGGK